uniref:RNA-directed RNA polymerase n=1 Tax=Kummerowia striata picorna-like virus TaxID=2739852 RepID=A0A6M9BJX2_9VIRU|nr:hypothetical protein 1 [Kummerowia striata picorna-like virus]
MHQGTSGITVKHHVQWSVTYTDLKDTGESISFNKLDEQYFTPMDYKLVSQPLEGDKMSVLEKFMMEAAGVRSLSVSQPTKAGQDKAEKVEPKPFEESTRLKALRLYEQYCQAGNPEVDQKTLSLGAKTAAAFKTVGSLLKEWFQQVYDFIAGVLPTTQTITEKCTRLWRILVDAFMRFWKNSKHQAQRFFDMIKYYCGYEDKEGKKKDDVKAESSSSSSDDIQEVSTDELEAFTQSLEEVSMLMAEPQGFMTDTWNSFIEDFWNPTKKVFTKTASDVFTTCFSIVTAIVGEIALPKPQVIVTRLREYLSIACMLERLNIGTFFKKCIDWVYHLFTGNHWFEQFDVEATFSRLYKEIVNEIVELEKLNNPPLLRCRQVALKLQQFQEAYLKCINVDERRTNTLRTMHTEVEKRARVFLATYKGATRRIKPVSSILKGQSASGKTVSTIIMRDTMIDIITKLLADMDKDSPVFKVFQEHAKQTGSWSVSCLKEPPEYDEGYNCQLFYMFEELYTSTQEEINTLWSSKLFEMCDDQPLLLNTAFGDKGTKFFDSPFVIATTNAHQHTIPMKDKNAYFRRIDFDWNLERPEGDSSGSIWSTTKWKLSDDCAKVLRSKKLRPHDTFEVLDIPVTGSYTLAQVLYITAVTYVLRITRDDEVKVSVLDVEKHLGSPIKPLHKGKLMEKAIFTVAGDDVLLPKVKIDPVSIVPTRLPTTTAVSPITTTTTKLPKVAKKEVFTKKQQEVLDKEEDTKKKVAEAKLKNQQQEAVLQNMRLEKAKLDKQTAEFNKQLEEYRVKADQLMRETQELEKIKLEAERKKIEAQQHLELQKKVEQSAKEEAERLARERLEKEKQNMRDMLEDQAIHAGVKLSTVDFNDDVEDEAYIANIVAEMVADTGLAPEVIQAQLEQEQHYKELQEDRDKEYGKLRSPFNSSEEDDEPPPVPARPELLGTELAPGTFTEPTEDEVLNQAIWESSQYTVCEKSLMTARNPEVVKWKSLERDFIVSVANGTFVVRTTRMEPVLQLIGQLPKRKKFQERILVAYNNRTLKVIKLTKDMKANPQGRTLQDEQDEKDLIHYGVSVYYAPAVRLSRTSLYQTTQYLSSNINSNSQNWKINYEFPPGMDVFSCYARMRAFVVNAATRMQELKDGGPFENPDYPTTKAFFELKIFWFAMKRLFSIVSFMASSEKKKIKYALRKEDREIIAANYLKWKSDYQKQKAYEFACPKPGIPGWLPKNVADVKRARTFRAEMDQRHHLRQLENSKRKTTTNRRKEEANRERYLAQQIPIRGPRGGRGKGKQRRDHQDRRNYKEGVRPQAGTVKIVGKHNCPFSRDPKLRKRLEEIRENMSKWGWCLRYGADTYEKVLEDILLMPTIEFDSRTGVERIQPIGKLTAMLTFLEFFSGLSFSVLASVIVYDHMVFNFRRYAYFPRNASKRQWFVHLLYCYYAQEDYSYTVSLRYAMQIEINYAKRQGKVLDPNHSISPIWSVWKPKKFYDYCTAYCEKNTEGAQDLFTDGPPVKTAILQDTLVLLGSIPIMKVIINMLPSIINSVMRSVSWMLGYTPRVKEKLLNASDELIKFWNSFTEHTGVRYIQAQSGERVNVVPKSTITTKVSHDVAFQKANAQSGNQDSLVNDICMNSYWLASPISGNRMGSMTFIKGTLAILNKHVYESVGEELRMRAYKCTVGSINMYNIPKERISIVASKDDLLLVNIPEVRQHRNIVNMFATLHELHNMGESLGASMVAYDTNLMQPVNIPISNLQAWINVARRGFEKVSWMIGDRTTYNWAYAVPGACGTIGIAHLNIGCRITHIHVAGQTSQNYGVGQLLSRELIDHLLDFVTPLQASTGCNLSFCDKQATPQNFYDYDHDKDVFTTPVMTSPMSRTVFTPTEFEKLQFKGGSPKKPANLGKEAYDLAKAKESKLKDMLYLRDEVYQILKEYGEEIMNQFSQLPPIRIQGCRTLTFKEAMYGYKTLGPFDLSTSRGLRLKLLGVKKKNLADPESEETKILEALIDIMIEQFKRGDFTRQLNADSLKDEPRDMERVLLKKTRCFNVTDFIDNVLLKMALGDLVEKLKKSFMKGPAACGINVSCSMWKELYYKFKAYLEVVFSDIAGFDYLMSLWLKIVILPWLTKNYGGDPDSFAVQFAHWAFVSCMEAIRFAFGVGRCLNRGNTSGNWLTTFWNTITNWIFHAVTCIYLAKLQGIDPLTALKNLVAVLYSDDNISANPVLESWNVVQFACTMTKLFGMEVTSTSKVVITEDTPLEHYTIDDADFLSRKFYYNKGVVYCPLAYDSLITQIYYVRIPRGQRNKQKINEQLQINLENVSRELIEYPHEEAQKISREITQFIAEHRLPVTMPKLNYKVERSELKFQYY